MSNKVKNIIVRSLLIVLFVLSATLGGFLIKSNKDIKTLDATVENLKTINNSLTTEKIDNFVILTVILDNETTYHYFVDKSLNISVYDFLLSQDFTLSDFASFNDEDYYFSVPNKFVKTEVLELQNNTNFYADDGFGPYLFKGLQAVIINQNLTVSRSDY